MSVSDLPEGAWIDGPVPCRDPECEGTAEPDGDAEIRYYACDTCGFEFGYQILKQELETCQIGVPEEVRRRAQAVQPQQPVVLQIGRRPE